MAVLISSFLPWAPSRRWLLLLTLLAATLPAPAAATPAPTKEYQVKAAFLFNFAQFVDWPPAAFADAQAPLVIGILGEDPFGAYLEDLVRGEKVNNRTLRVQRYRHPAEIAVCHVLFISRSMFPQLDPILAGLKGRNILTVGDAEGFALHGGMIRFVTENNRVRFRINLEAAKAADLTISSKLLRPAEIVTPGKD